MKYLVPLSQLEDLQRIKQVWGVPPWVMIVIGVIMFASWTLSYTAIIRRAFRDKTYGVPVPEAPLNICWEFIFAFNRAGRLPAFLFPLAWGHILWLLPDSLVIYQTLRFGPSVQTNPFLKRWFRLIVVCVWAVEAVGLYSFIFYFHDDYGVASSFLMNVIMSTLFIGLFFKRPDLKGLSYTGAWLKMIGTAAGGVFCFFWWPAQFVNGSFIAHYPNGIGYVSPEPRSYVFVTLMYLIIPVLDGLYVYLLWSRRRELRDKKTVSRYFAVQQ